MVTVSAMVLKTNGANFSVLDQHDTLKRLRKQASKFSSVDKLPNVYLIHGDLTVEEMAMLYNHPKITAEEAATYLFLAKDEIRESILLTAAEEHDKMNRSSVWPAPEDRWINETFSMVILTKKEVEKRINKHPDELTEWLDANHRELGNLIDRGVIKLVRTNDLKNLDKV